ncbi:MAG TPA: sterol desaturase family protein [Alphaproteobacteria bacterium]|nr:sterol desaturase family protein [Alphaproteobacteria bacterium]
MPERLALIDWPNVDVQGLLSALPIAVFAAILIFEVVRPRRRLRASPLRRWVGNTGLFLINTAAVLPLAQAGAAMVDGFSLRSDLLGRASAPFHYLAGQIGGVILLDLLLYLLHRAYHLVPFLWRFHAVHHADTDVDATTAVRHHPGEHLANYAILSLVAAALGLSPAAIVVYGVLVLTLQMAQHANIDFPEWLDRQVRRAVVTPNMHRVHHSIALREGNSNFGTVLSIWDRLWRTYLEPTASRRAAADFGVQGLEDRRYQRLHWMLLTPAMIGSAPLSPQRGEPPSISPTGADAPAEARIARE